MGGIGGSSTLFAAPNSGNVRVAGDPGVTRTNDITVVTLIRAREELMCTNDVSILSTSPA
jgi:hypothetical protein